MRAVREAFVPAITLGLWSCCAYTGATGWARGILILNDFHIPSSLAKDSAEASTALSSSACPASDKLIEDLIEELIEAFCWLPQHYQTASQSWSFPVGLDSAL